MNRLHSPVPADIGQQLWRNGDISPDAFIAENVRICLRRIAELLNDDQRGPIPHYCVTFAATSRILVLIARVSAALCDEGITQEALGICSLLIDSEEEAFLEDRAFADALPDFIESIQRSARQISDTDIENTMVEVLFGIAAKLRIEPHLLRVWFRPEKPEEDDEELSDSERRTRFEEFPLFYFLLHYVPAEGRAGEFARMGLLYLIESTAQSEDLEKWIVNGDMAALMASGLGALYSQLSRKLAICYPKNEVPSILVFSDRLKAQAPQDAEETTSAEYQAHLGTFLASLIFWQDLLEHCASIDVKQTLLDHFQYLFLQQLLYPSLLESSDVDGGSAVAVLTYLRHILESIDHPDLVRLTLQYLFGQEVPAPIVNSSARPIARVRRRKSEILVARLSKEDHFSPDLFNLTDLIVSSLRSKSQQTITATLHLFSAMLRRRHHQSMPNLLKTESARVVDDQRTIGAQEKEIDKLLTLAETLTAFQDLESSYEKHLYDNRNILETHPCSVQLLNLESVGKETYSKPKPNSPEVARKLLRVEDPILKSIVSLVERFFDNDIETNLGLTQVIVDLASCGYLSIEGWLVTHPSRYSYPKEQERRESLGKIDSGDNSNPVQAQVSQLRRIMLARRQPVWQSENASPIYKALDKLVQDAESFQREISDFDIHLLDCRNALDGGEDVDSVVGSTHTPSRKSQDSGRTSPTRAMNVPHQMGSINERLKSDRAYGGDSGAESPRGRQLDMPPSTPTTLVGRLSHLNISPTRSASPGTSRTYSPSPFRGGGIAGGKDLLSATPPTITSKPRLGSRGVAISNDLSRRVRIASWESATSSSGFPRKGELSSDSDDEDEDEDDGEGREQEENDDENDEDATDSLYSGSGAAALSTSPLSRSLGDTRQAKKGKKAVGTAAGHKGEVSLGHLLTNVVILQEFILELAALVEVRASLFGEVRNC